MDVRIRHKVAVLGGVTIFTAPLVRSPVPASHSLWSAMVFIDW
jgi:hypothetical protein